MAIGNIRIILQILGQSKGAESSADRVRVKVNQLNIAIRQGQKRTATFGAGIRDLSNGFRMLGQAALNLGMTFSMLVGIPIAAALKGGGEAAISFEHMLVRVEKTTGLAREGIKELGQNLLQLARYTATPINELAKIAEVAGQMGFRAPAAISRVVEIVNMLAVATEMTAEESARSLGKIASAWGFLGDKAAAVFGPLGNTINMLENRFNATAGEIVEGMLRASSAAAMLGISMTDTAAMVTTLISAGERASSAGTMLNRVFVTMVQNLDLVAAALGTTGDVTKERIQKDAIGVITDFLDYLGRVPGVADRLGLSMEVAGWRGGRGLAHLTTGSELLESAMKIAHDEFEGGTSLIDEYNKAMESTQNQLAILKNNLSVAAVTIGDVLLPKINDLIQIAVPAIQRLVNAFIELPEKTQLIIMGVAALTAVAGPLLVLFGSLAFSIGMTGGAFIAMARGVIGLGGSLLGITSIVGKLVSVLLGLLPIGGSLAALLGGLAPLVLAVGSAIAIGLIAATDQGQRVLENLSQVIEGYIDAAQNWGEGLMNNLAVGILNAANWVIEACITVGETIASFFAAASAPERGPLSQIGQWGRRLIDTYLQAFKTADFSVLKSVGRIISGYFENLATAGLIDETDIVPKTAAAREKIAEIIAAFNETGVVAEDKMAELRDMLGEAGDEIERLVRLQLEYNEAQAIMKGAEERKKAVGEQYQSEVQAIKARTDLTDEEKRAAISAAYERARAVERAIDDEVKAAEGVAGELQEQIQWQKGYVGGLEETDSLYAKQIKLLDRINRAVQAVAGAARQAIRVVKDKLKTLEDELALNQKLQAEYKTAGLDTKALLQEELRLRKQIVEEKVKRDIPIGEDLARISELGAEIEAIGKGFDIPKADAFSTTINEMLTTTEKWGESIETVKTKFQEGGLAIDAFLAGLRGEPPAMLEVLPGKLNEAHIAGQKIHDVWLKITGIFDRIKTAATGPILPDLSAVLPEGIQVKLQRFGAWWGEKWPLMAAAALTVLTLLKAAFQSAIDVIVGTVGPKLKRFIDKLTETLNKLGLDWGDVWNVIKGVVTTVVIVVIGLLMVLLGIVVGVIDGIVSALDGAIDGWSKLVLGVRRAINDVKNIITDIGNFFRAVWAKDWDAAGRAAHSAVVNAKSLIKNTLDAIVGLFEANLGFITGLVGGFIGGIVEYFQDLYNDLVGGSIVSDLINEVVRLFGTLPALIEGILQGLGALIAKPFEAVGTALGKMFGGDVDFDPKQIVDTLISIKTKISELPQAFQMTVDSILNKALLWVAGMLVHFQTIQTNFQVMLSQMLSAFQDAMAQIETTFNNFVKVVLEGLQKLIVKWQAFIDKINESRTAIEKVKDAIEKITSDEVIGWIDRLIKRFEKLEEAAKAAAKAMKAAAAAGGGGSGAPASAAPGAQRGIWNVPRQMLRTLHPKEAVLPANVAEPFRAAFGGMAPLTAGATIGAGGTASLYAPINIYNPQFTDEAAIQELVGRVSVMLGQRVERLQRARGLTF